MTIKVAVVGANGRMGGLATRLVESTDGFELFAAIGSTGSLEQMIGADAVIDFTVPHVSPTVVAYAVEHGVPALVGTSGWTAERIDELQNIVGDAEAAVIIAPNFSLGSVLATRLAATAARFFDSIEIIESHHERKIDSPSGTAVRTAELMERARADRGVVEAPHSDQLARGELVAGIPVHSLRMRGVAARQQVLFGGDGEQLSIHHDILSNAAYEAGILIGLRALARSRGVIVGLDALLGLEPLA